MEQEKKTGRSLKELFDMLSDKAKSKAMYSSFTNVLFEEIKTKEVRQDLAINIVKHIATIDAAARAKVTPETKESEAVTRELTDAFEIECKSFADEIMKLPALFREKMASKPKREADAFDLIAVVLGNCDCENCQENRRMRAERAEKDSPSPEAPIAGEAPLG